MLSRTRAKNLNGKWCYGYYYEDRAGAYIQEPSSVTHTEWPHPVKAETKGMYCGRNTPDGKPIYEGDIIRYKDLEPMVVIFDTRNTAFGITKVSQINVPHINGDLSIVIDFAFDDWNRKDDTLTILGNIHDNPELLKEK